VIESVQELEVSNVRRFKPYPAYKPTGMEWLGDVPEHWDVRRLKFVGDAIIGLTYDPSDLADEVDGVLVLRASNVTGGRIIREDNVFVNRKIQPRLITRIGDILICSRSGSRALIGKNAKIDRDSAGLTFGTFMTVFRSNCNDYLFYVFNSSLFEYQSGVFLTSTINQLTVANLYSFEVPTPPPDEQAIIVRFLEQQLASIDRLIDKKRALIGRLKEKRSAVISRTVTHGLPPDAARVAGLNPQPPMKPSGIDWVGEVPAHWKEMMLKRAWSTCDYGISDALAGDGTIKVLTMGNVQDGEVHLPENGALDEVEENMLLTDGDLLFNRTNSLAHVGKVGICRGIAHERVTFASYLVRIRTNHRALPPFLNFLLNTPQQLTFLRCLALPSINQANLNPTRYGQIRVFLPPTQEQQVIVDFLDEQSAKINDMVRSVQVAIGQLEEYRAALISAAVTGKIDVRGATA
jgi:type I restriction enzyme S subunit